jgi:hypothetical protein
MTRVHTVLLFAFALGIGGCGGCGQTAQKAGTIKEITTESIKKGGDTWTVKITSRIDAPVDKVFEAWTQPERAKDLAPDNVLKSELVSQDGNTKVVDIVGRLDVLPPGFKVQNLRNEWKFFPDEKRITSRSVDFKMADLSSEYVFKAAPDGKGTIVEFTQTSKDKSPMLVDSLQEGALRETYVRQVQMVNKALGLAAPAAKPAS